MDKKAIARWRRDTIIGEITMLIITYFVLRYSAPY